MSKKDLNHTVKDVVINEKLMKNFGGENISRRILSEEEITNLLMHEVMAIQNGVHTDFNMSNMQPQKDKPLTGFGKLEQDNAFESKKVQLEDIENITGLKLVSPNTLRDKFTATDKKNKPQ